MIANIETSPSVIRALLLLFKIQFDVKNLCQFNSISEINFHRHSNFSPHFSSARSRTNEAG